MISKNVQNMQQTFKAGPVQLTSKTVSERDKTQKQGKGLEMERENHTNIMPLTFGNHAQEGEKNQWALAGLHKKRRDLTKGKGKGRDCTFIGRKSSQPEQGPCPEPIM